MAFRMVKLTEFENKYNVQLPFRYLIDHHDTIIAGGAIRDWIDSVINRKPYSLPKDIDVFRTNKTGINKYIYFYYHDLKTPIHHVVIKFGTTVSKLLNSFDFTINQCAICLHEGEFYLVVGDTTIDDILNRQLYYANDGTGTHPIYHMKRIGKFAERGYHVTIDTMLKVHKAVAKRIERKGMDELDDLDYEEHTTGSHEDMAWGDCE